MATTNKERQANLNKASGLAFKRLKEDHLDEWNGYMSEETKKLKEPWEPKPDEETKALRELEALLKDHPELADKVPAILGQPTLPDGNDEDDIEQPELEDQLTVKK